MTLRIPIRRLTGLRPDVTDQTLLDYLDLAIITPEPGLVATSALRERWSCSQSQVSRRIHAVAAAGLAEITTGWGAYRVHGLGLTAETP
jgi:hypothetical protein